MKKPASLITRFLALVADLAISHAIYHLLFSLPYFRLLVKEVTASIPFGEGDFSNEFAFILMIFMICQIQRFYFTLIFGVSPGQWVCGIKSYGSGVLKRFGGGARVVLETFLGPFIIFDLPVLLGKRSYKEKATGTLLYSSDSALALGGKVIIVPMLFLATLFSPLLQNLELIDGLIVSFSNEQSVRLNNQTDFSSFKLYPSNRFHLKAFSDLDKGRLILLPSFEVIKKNGQKIITPFLTIYDRDNKAHGHLRIYKKFDLLTLLKKGSVSNPLFPARYPELNKVLHSNPEKFAMKEKSDEEFIPIFNPVVVEEIKDFIQSCFEITFSKMVSHILDKGPFVSGYMTVRNSFLRILKRGAIPEVDILKIGNKSSLHPFLRFRQIFPKEFALKRGHIETLIPIGTPHSFIFEFSWTTQMNSAVTRKIFTSSFFNTAEWVFDFNNPFAFPDAISDLTPMHVIDWLIKGELKKDQRARLEDYIFQYYYGVIRQALLAKDEILSDLVYQDLKRISVITKIRNNKTPGYFSRIFLEDLRGLIKATKSKNLKFFNL